MVPGDVELVGADLQAGARVRRHHRRCSRRTSRCAPTSRRKPRRTRPMANEVVRRPSVAAARRLRRRDDAPRPPAAGAAAADSAKRAGGTGRYHAMPRRAQFDTLAAAGERPLMRETYHYEGIGPRSVQAVRRSWRRAVPNCPISSWSASSTTPIIPRTVSRRSARSAASGATCAPRRADRPDHRRQHVAHRRDAQRG